MTDLTPRSLDELESSAVLALSNPSLGYWVHPDHVRALIAMARAKQAAERERDALRELVVRLVSDDPWLEGYNRCFWCGGSRALSPLGKAEGLREDHADDCAWLAARAQLADAGGAK